MGVDGLDARLAAAGVVPLVVLAAFVHAFVGTFVVGLFLYYVTRPVYRELEDALGSAPVAAAVALGTLALPLVVLLAGLGLAILHEFHVLGRVDLVAQSQSALAPVVRATEDPGRLLALLRGEGDAGQVAGLARAVGLGLTHGFVMLALAFYLLQDDDRLASLVRRYDRRGVATRYFEAVDRSLYSVFYGNILTAAFTGIWGVLMYVGLNLVAPPGLAIPYPVLTGCLVGVASLIPIVGMKIVYVPLAGYLFTAWSSAPGDGGLWFVAAFLAVSAVVVDVIPDVALRPYVSGRDLHMGALMVTYVLGPLFFGWYGLFLAPLLLVVVVQFVRVVLPAAVARGAAPGAVDPAVASGGIEGGDRPFGGSPSLADSGDGSAPDGSPTGDGGGGPGEAAPAVATAERNGRSVVVRRVDLDREE